MLALLSSDRLWVTLAIASGLLIAGQIVELLPFEPPLDMDGFGL